MAVYTHSDAGSVVEAEPFAVPGNYLTDGRHLLYVDRVTDSRAGDPVVVIENCRTLEILLFPVRDFERLRLRRVAGRD